MRLALLLPALAAAALALPPAFASEGEKHEAKAEKKDDGGLFGSADNIVPLPVVIAPVNTNGYLTSHLYMFLAAVTPSTAEANKVKEKMPYVLDALILAVYKDIATVPSRDAEPDYSQVIARVKDTVNGVMGRDVVTEIKVGRIDTAPY